MAKKQTTSKTVEALKHDEATRKNIPTAEYQSVMQKNEQDPVRVAYALKQSEARPKLQAPSFLTYPFAIQYSKHREEDGDVDSKTTYQFLRTWDQAILMEYFPPESVFHPNPEFFTSVPITPGSRLFIPKI